MLNLGSFALGAPWLLGFLAALPLLWWLLRLTPPAPRKVLFPALALLKNLVAREEVPARSPWWLLLLRLTIAALLIVAFAKPLLHPLAVSQSHGTLLIAVDNDWAAARDWDMRRAMLRDLLQNAEHDHRQVILLPTAPDVNAEALTLPAPVAAAAILQDIDHLVPHPWFADWRQATALLRDAKNADIGEAVWIASGLGSVDSKAFVAALRTRAPTKVYGGNAPIYSVQSPVSEGDTSTLAVMRATTDQAATVTLNALAADGAILANWPVAFVTGAPRVVVTLALPADMRNRIARFEVAEQHTAGATALLDAVWQHRSVGIVGDAAELDRHSLLSEIFYIDRALKPYADIHVDTLEALIKANPPIIILTDATTITHDMIPALTSWVKQGGILLRFAGERFAAVDDHKDETALLPVPLRSGERSLGGALTWGTPQLLQAFPASSPFHDLPLPADVTVSRQLLAEPSPDLAGKTWASLADGTPLVTAATLGQGMTILFHVPAHTGWSNLPISGLFVSMLQRILNLSRGNHAVVPSAQAALPPLRMLDAFGLEHAPSSAMLPLSLQDGASISITPQHPPGLYGSDSDNVALNLGAVVGQPEGLRDVKVEEYIVHAHETDLQPALLVAAFLLLLLDGVVSLRMRGFLKIALLALAFFTLTTVAQAAVDEKMGVELTSKTYIAYVRTGDAGVDHVAELGLHSLALALQARTSIDHVGVARVDPATDDLAFFPLLYWPVTAAQQPLSAEGAKRVTYYVQHGGMILFDAADGGDAAPVFLQRVLAGVELPPLQRLPEKHVLKRSFYLLDDFPGRFTGNDFWLEPEQASSTDGVASVLYGSNGWAAAWALDDAGHALYPCTPGGEAQREQAFRFGVNLVLYALTGNYKNDQVHTTSLLEKMGP